MMTWLGLVWMLVIMAMISWGLANAIVNALLLFLQKTDLARLRGELWLLVALPVLLPLLTVFSLFFLSLAKYVGWVDDHCLEHLQHHPHFCLLHLPDFLVSHVQYLMGILSMVVLWSVVSGQLIGQFRQHAKARSLKQLLVGQRLLKSLDDMRPFAFTIGLTQPVLCLSEGLKALLTKRQQRIVAAHEVAHIRNHDVLKNSLFELLLIFHVHRAHLRSHWQLAMEGSADDQVAKRFPRLDIAEVLLKLERAKSQPLVPVSIAGANCEKRIRRLLQVEQVQSSGGFKLSLLALTFLFPILLTLNHHAVETVVGWWLAV